MEGMEGDAKARILAAALRMVDASGAGSITVRKVAADAQVNVAAVNYYFGSKEGLIQQALKGLMGNFLAAFHLLDGQEEPHHRLKAFLWAYIETALRYPDIVRSIVGLTATGRSLTGYSVEERTANEYEGFVRTAGMEKIAAVIGQATGCADRSELALMAVQMMSSLTVPLLAGQAVKRATGIDLADPDTRGRYIDLLIRKL